MIWDFINYVISLVRKAFQSAVNFIVSLVKLFFKVLKRLFFEYVYTFGEQLEFIGSRYTDWYEWNFEEEWSGLRTFIFIFLIVTCIKPIYFYFRWCGYLYCGILAYVFVLLEIIFEEIILPIFYYVGTDVYNLEVCSWAFYTRIYPFVKRFILFGFGLFIVEKFVVYLDSLRTRNWVKWIWKKYWSIDRYIDFGIILLDEFYELSVYCYERKERQTKKHWRMIRFFVLKKKGRRELYFISLFLIRVAYETVIFMYIRGRLRLLYLFLKMIADIMHGLFLVCYFIYAFILNFFKFCCFILYVIGYIIFFIWCAIVTLYKYSPFYSFYLWSKMKYSQLCLELWRRKLYCQYYYSVFRDWLVYLGMSPEEQAIELKRLEAKAKAELYDDVLPTTSFALLTVRKRYPPSYLFPEEEEELKQEERKKQEEDERKYWEWHDKMAAEVLNFKKEPIDINNLPKRQKPQKTQEQKDEEAKAYELWCKLSLEAETLLRADQAEKEVKKQEEAKRKQEEDAKKKEEDAKKKKEEDEIWQHKYNHMSLKEKFFQENLLKRNSNYKLYDELLQKMEEQKQYVNEVTNQAKLDFSVYLKYLVLEKKYILNIDFSSKSIFIIYYVLYLADKQKLEERHAIKIELNRVLAEAEKKWTEQEYKLDLAYWDYNEIAIQVKKQMKVVQVLKEEEKWEKFVNHRKWLKFLKSKSKIS